MKETIQYNKFVELNYKVLDKKTKQVLSTIEFPISYVHGVNQVLESYVTEQLEGCCAGDIIEIPIDGHVIYGSRDESLVFTDLLENVPRKYQEVGLKILMENKQGETKEFIVTHIDEKTLTIDGNHPLCGRDLIFKLEILTVRNSTQEEIQQER